jgi:hypothetical protein
VPQLRQLFAGFLLQKGGFNFRPVHVKFVVDKVAVQHACLQVIRVSTVLFIPPLLHPSMTDAIIVTDSVVK